METITITSKTDGKYPYITAGKARYGVKSLTGLEIGKTYDCEINIRKVRMQNGDTFNARDIASWKEHVAMNGNGALTEKDKHIETLSNHKNETISRVAALNNACLMVDAVAKVLASKMLIDAWTPEYVSQHLQDLKDREYSDNLKRLGIKSDASDTF